MPCIRYVAVCCFLLLWATGPRVAVAGLGAGLGADAAQAQEHRVRCGAYSYVLPNGFTAFDMLQPFEKFLYLNTRDNATPHKARSGVTCIRKKKIPGAEFVLESQPVQEELPRLKDTRSYTLELYEEDIAPGARVYHQMPYMKGADKSWQNIWVEMDNPESNEYVVLYFWSISTYYTVNRKGRKPLLAELTDTQLRDRALDFVRSIRREHTSR